MAEDEQDATTGPTRPMHYPDRPITIPSPALAARYDAETLAESWARWRRRLAATDLDLTADRPGSPTVTGTPS